ncbi:riboflavin synthase [Methylocella sp.]|uniref:riboflavin synthase n=1 Tax=Methylocella sp. TaxID=1978226 RepID=UPI0037849292
MFTGIVTDVGRIASLEPRGGLTRARVLCAYDAATIALGASIACDGVCLTVVASGREDAGSWFEVDVGAETLARTTADAWREGQSLNLERALKIGDELGGHIVTGHVDGLATIESLEDFDGMKRFRLRAPHALARFVAEKGSVALDGTSLTVNGVEDDVFSILLIPHTIAATVWRERRVGDRVNLEVDLMARYAARLAEAAA